MGLGKANLEYTLTNGSNFSFATAVSAESDEI